MCNSGLYHEPVYDAKGIYVTGVCTKCWEEALSKYRPEIFTDPNYEADEQIEEDE